ncbi:uncharacterized protein M421DRAFT_417420 [Didymella exigua CBS 183.55]|uniref:CBF1-interacting co-repressor CIR N-terminal domain-containing protein n=1 Tax=Didymella exigua CBS 183.55 TaxID=1150837 RepID=A0A6A5RT69_9PLEO|nr:uncharacterized protein M421DRAFT_417420 [Didymella exigua CBS 183.55]KAF1931655.1 hypothetical protein M421DRAFT_417420 [Didymella exigua CBS 183.55]
MPLHLLGKKSWNVYNPANIARVKADEDAAAAREHAADQRMQELDAERRAAILRGRTPPPLPEEDAVDDSRRRRDRHGHDKKRRKLRGEDDTDMDIRLAASMTRPQDGNEDDAKVLKLRKPASNAPLTDHAGHIDLFPVDVTEAIKREKNAEAEREKRKKEQAFEDQYTMRFSNAAGRNGLDQPWYTAQQKTARTAEEDSALVYPGLENKNVWGNEDPRRKEREQARISSNDPFAFMQKAQTQLKKSKEDRKKWTHERKRELQGLKDAQEREERRSKHHKSSRRRSRSRSQTPDRERLHKHPPRKDRSRSRSRDRDRGRDRRDHRSRHSSSRHHRSRSPSNRTRRDEDQRKR